MIRQDYILRMIEQAAQMIAQIIRLRNEGEPLVADEVEKEGVAKFLQLSSDDLTDWDEQSLFRHLRTKGVPSEFPLRLGFAVAILKERAQTQHADQYLVKAIGILLRAKIESIDADLPMFAPGLTDLLQCLKPEDVPDSTKVLLMCYYEHAGRFSEAEDTLFDLLESAGTGDQIRKLGDDFFQRLKGCTDRSLIDGDLPRNEVEEGARQWDELFQ